MKITEMQKSNEVYHVIPTAKAQPLLDDGYVQAVTLDPVPEHGMTAVSLTSKGRGFTEATK